MYLKWFERNIDLLFSNPKIVAAAAVHFCIIDKSFPSLFILLNFVRRKQM